MKYQLTRHPDVTTLTLLFDGSAAPESFAELEDVLCAAPKKHFRFLVCVPRRWLIARWLEWPAQRRPEIRRMAAYQAASLLPFPEEDCAVDAAALGWDPARGVSNVFLAALRNCHAAALGAMFERLDRYPDAFVPSCFALRAFVKNAAGIDDDCYLHLHVQDEWIELDLIVNHEIASSRAVPVRKSGVTEQALSECRASLKPFGSAALRRVITTGDWGAMGAETARILETELKVSVEFVEPLSGSSGSDSTIVEASESSDASKAEGRHARVVLQCDPLLSGCESVGAEYHFDFLSNELRRKRDAARMRRDARAIVLRLGLLAGAFIATFGWRIAARHIELAKIGAQIRRIEPEALKVSEALRRAELLQSDRAAGASPLAALRDLHAIVPSGIALTALTQEEDGRILLQGSAERYSDVLDLVNRLEESRRFSRAELKTSGSRTVNGRRKVEFQVQCRSDEAADES